MSALTITAANVLPSTNARIEPGLFGATITAGKSLYLDTSVTPNKWKLADNNSTAATAGSDGLAIALSGGSDGQQGFVQRGGLITIGATVAVGVTYCVGDTAGDIVPDADVTTGGTMRKSILGVGTTTGVISMLPFASGALVA